MKSKKLLCTLFLGAALANSSSLKAQAWWERTYGLPNNNEHSGQGYYDPTLRRMVIAGTCDFSAITSGVLHAPNVVVTNRVGHPLPLPGPSIYDKYYILKDAANTPMDAEANGCIRLASGEIGLAGNVRPTGSTNRGDVLFMRVNPSTGAVIGAYSFDIGGEEYATKLYQDNNYIYITGYQYSGFYGHQRMFVLKTDVNGVLFWSKWYELYDVFTDDRITTANDLLVHNGSIYVVGTTQNRPAPPAAVHDNAFFAKIDEPTGNMLTASIYSNTENSGFNKIIKTQSNLLTGEFIVTGFMETAINDFAFWTANINTVGVLTNQSFESSPWLNGQYRRNYAYDVKERLDPNTNQYEYYVVGDAENINPSSTVPSDVMLVKLDQTLTGVRTFQYNTPTAGGSDDHGRAIDFTGTTLPQNGYVLFGHVPYQTNPTPNNMNLYMVKSDYLGSSTCNFNQYSPSPSSTSITSYSPAINQDQVFNPVSVSADVTESDVYEVLCDIFVSAKNDLSTGNKEIGKNAAVSFYPNPANNSLNIEAPAGTYNYTVMDIQGKQVLNGLSKSGETIQIDALQPGIYFLHLQGENGINENFKFIKQ